MATRLEQWLARRAKMIRRANRAWNARPRGGSGIPYHPATGEIQHGGGWQTHGEGKLKKPVLKPETYRKQMRAHILRVGVSKVGEIGYANPPHYKSTLPPVIRDHPKVHWRERINGVMYRSVQRWKHKAGRDKGDKRLGYRAWCYWRRRGYWPNWDPKSRTPVDPQPRAVDSDWDERPE